MNTIKATINKRIATLENEIEFLKSITETSVYLEERNDKYIVVKPYRSTVSQIIILGTVHLTTKYHELNHRSLNEDFNALDIEKLETKIKELGCVYVPVYVQKNKQIRIATTPFEKSWSGGLAGYMYMTPDDLSFHKYTEEQAKEHLEEIVYDLDKNENDQIYAISIVSKDKTTCVQSFLKIANNKERKLTKEDHKIIQHGIDYARKMIDNNEA